MNISLWIVQGLLAFAFGMAGGAKLALPKAKFAEQQPWAESFSSAAIKGIGAVEVAGATGVVVPMVTGIAPQLTPLAAVGLMCTMVGAMVTHARRREYRNMAVNLVLLLLAAVVAYGRGVHTSAETTPR